jgi:hypothetical protein
MNNEELELRREVSRAEAARAYIEDPILVEAFETVRQFYTDQWTNSPAGAVQLREDAWHRLRALAEVRFELQRVLDDGMLALERLNDLRDGITNP